MDERILDRRPLTWAWRLATTAVFAVAVALFAAGAAPSDLATARSLTIEDGQGHPRITLDVNDQGAAVVELVSPDGSRRVRLSAGTEAEIVVTGRGVDDTLKLVVDEVGNAALQVGTPDKGAVLASTSEANELTVAGPDGGARLWAASSGEGLGFELGSGGHTATATVSKTRAQWAVRDDGGKEAALTAGPDGARVAAHKAGDDSAELVASEADGLGLRVRRGDQVRLWFGERPGATATLELRR